MLLQQVFLPDRIKVGLESVDKDELFEELIDVLARADGRNFPRAAVLGAIRKREEKLSTGVKRGIALPHGMVEGLDGLTGALGISSRGIEYESLDGEPVYIVFLLLTSPQDSELHLSALKSLARLLDDPEFYTELVEAKSEDQAFEIIKQFEDFVRA
ncbi:MAG: PTS sugar transporter subunit IIA [Treponema sp.]|nr:PTS sugar transporter subunit IIA [Treponema sp.]